MNVTVYKLFITMLVKTVISFSGEKITISHLNRINGRNKLAITVCTVTYLGKDESEAIFPIISEETNDCLMTN